MILMLGAWSVPAWGGTWYAKINASADPSNGGYVYVGTNSNCTADNATSKTHNAENSASKKWQTSGDVNLWLCAKAKSGYTFKGWNTDQSNTVLSGSTSVPFKVTVHGSGKVLGIGGESYDYYAIFARMAANTPAAGSTISFDDTNVEDESGWKQIKIDHAHAGTVTLTQTGNDGDFYVASGTTATSELSSFTSTTEGTKTIYVKFVPQSQSIGPRSCTLTISSNNGLSSLTYYLSGTGYKVQTFEWNGNNGLPLTSGETTLGIGDTLRATCSSGQVVSYSGYSTSYFTATTDAQGQNVLVVKESISGNIKNQSVTANVSKSTNYYNDHSETFTLNLTNLTPQAIEWTNDLTDISNELIGHTIPLDAVAKNAKTGANTGQAITYSMAANSYMSLSGNVLTINAIGGPVAITATAAGNENYAPTSVTKYATVINMTDPCGTSDSYNGKTLDKDNKSLVIYPTLPGKLTFNLKRSTNLFILNKFTVKEYNSNNSLLATTEYDNSSISTSGETKTINCNVNATKIEFYCDAYLYYSCTVSNISTTRVTTSSVSLNSLSYETDPGQSLGKQVTVTYSNIPVFLSFKSDEDAGVKGASLWSVNTSHFGGCGKKGSQTVTVTFRSNAKGNYTDKLYVRNNVGDLLHTIDLSASVTAQEQILETWNIENTYNTTDQVTLAAATTVGNTDFTFTAISSNPANIVAITNAGVMTFTGSGTATIRAYQPGDALSQEFETTHNITINKVTPTIATNPSVETVKYGDVLNNSLLSNGKATVTLRGVANTEVEGTFAWTNVGSTVTNGAGNHDYQITFTPTDEGMYNSKTFTQSVTISRADGGIEMNDGSVKVKITGINDDLVECSLDLNSLIQSKVVDAGHAGNVTYEVTSENKGNASIVNGVFSATQVGTYTIRATQEQTNYYTAASDEFTVTVNKLVPEIVFDNQDNPEYIYSGDVIKKPAYRKYNGKEIDRNVQYVSSDPSITGAIHVAGTTLTARNVTAPEGSAVEVTITASASADALYAATTESVEHNYAVRAKRSPVFTMDTYVNENASKTLNIGEQAIITYNENTNGFLTVGTASEHAYVTFSHDIENRTITVTAVKGTITGDGVQQIIVNQPGNDYLFPREITYTFTVKRNVSALSLDPLTTAMEVEDTIATPYTGLANTETAVAFSCSPEGSMKMEDGKLIALQAGTNTVTFSQPATEFWTGISKSKTITVSKKNPNITTALSNRHPWYSIIEHPFKSLNTEKELQITSSNESLAKYIKEEDKIYVYGTSGNVTFTVNQDANYKYNAVVNYQKTFTIFQPNNRLPFTLTSSNLEDYKGGGSGSISWNDGGVVVGRTSTLAGPGGWEEKYIILKFVGVPDKLNFDFENTSSIATQYGWHFYQSSNGSDWNLIKEYQDLLMNASGGTSSGSESNLPLDPATQYIKLEYHGNYGGRFKNVHVTERKEIAPKDAKKDFGLGYNGNDPTMRAITVDWYNVKPCTVTITGTDADKFVLDEGSKTINSTLDHYGTVDLLVSYKHETNTESTHTATLHIEDEDGNYANVTLTGQTTPAPQTIIWRNDLTPMPIEGSFQNAAMVTTGQAVTLVSDHPEIVRVVDNTTLEPVSAGNARVTATAAGNDKWAETRDYLDIEVTTLKVQYITWTDNLSNRKREDGQTVEIELTATSSADLPITYELDGDAQAFASISGNVLSLTGWGSGQVIAKQVGNEEYVAVQATKTLVSRNPNAKCRPLVGEYKEEYTLHTLAEKIISLNGEPDSVTFWAKCDASALWGMWVAEEYDGFYHDVQEISRLGDPNITSSYQHYSFPLHRNATAVKLYTKTGATMTRTFKNVEIPLAKYLELAENTMNFSQVDKGSTKTQSFYINYSNLTGVLDVEMENTENTHFTVVTTTVGEDCGEIGRYVRIDISYTGSTLGDEENAILVHNADQSLRIPVTASVVLPSQTITWEQELNVLTTDHVVLSATATSELPVSFTSGNTEIAEVVYEAGVYSLDIKSYGDVAITAHQAGNEDWSAATDKTLTFHISRVVPEVPAWPTAGGVVLPNTVGGSSLTGGVAPEGIPGTFHWEDASLTVTRQAHTFNVVFEPSNPNYYETVSQALDIEILKTPQTITWNRADVSEEGCSDVVILDAWASSGLPITYHSSDSTKAYAIDAVVSEVAVKKLYILKGGDVTITAVQPGDDTYAAAPSVSKTISLNRVVPTIEELPTATYMYVHHFLSNSTPQGGVVKAGENTVDGVFNWENGSEVMDDPGTNQRTVVFHPYNSDFYQEVSAVIDVEVRRFAPTVLHDFTTETKVYGTTLSEFVLNGSGHGYDYTDPAHYEIDGTFAWKDADYIPSVAEEYAIMVFHPNHTEWYDDVEIQVPIQLTKATLLGATATATMFYGQVLGDAEITNTTNGIVNGTVGVVAGTITWDSSLDLMAYYTEGTHPGLPIRFTPTDPNYEPTEIAGTAVLTVNAGYVFDGNDGQSKAWDEDENWRDHVAPENNNNEKVVILADVDITGPVSVDALTIKDDVTVTVKNGATLTIGSSDSYKRTTYGNLYVETGGKVVLNGGELKVKDFVLEAELGDNTTVHPATSGQVNGDEKLNIQGDAYFRISFDPRGAIDYGWYDFTVPFEVDVVNGIFDKDGHKLTNNVDYAIMAFSEAKRAENVKPWTWFSGTLEPGKLYSITLDDAKNWNTFLFKRKSSVANFGSNVYGASYTENGETTNRGWNGLGNGTLRHCQLNNLPAQTKIQVYDHGNDRYVELEASDYTYAVGTAFFVQVDEAKNIDLTSVSEVRSFLAPTSERRTVDEFRLALTAEGAEVAADYLWVSASEDATGEYVIGHDLLKMGTPNTAKVAQMWTVNNGLTLCDVEMPLVGNNANTSLNLYAPQEGTYEIAVEKSPADATLYLTKNGRVVWNLSMSPYELDLTKGTTEGYGLRIVADRQTTTDVENTRFDNQPAGAKKVLIDDQIYIVLPDGRMYNVQGARL
jgi:uncharacterized repeat protein (TIGR02543 family)